MTTTTPSPAEPTRPRTRGFTLVELMVAAGLSGFVLTGVLTCFLMLGRSGANLVNYTDMESEARSGLETFAQDTRMANDIVWNSINSVTLVVPASGTNERYTYTYNPTTLQFTRQRTGPTTGTAVVLISGISAFNFKAYRVNASEIDLEELVDDGDLDQANIDTKQLQISLNASRTSSTVATATNTVLSARFILRNKRITT
jgi:prepilin-type N-terminal cleavage/methylation domain-containing protein